MQSATEGSSCPLAELRERSSFVSCTKQCALIQEGGIFVSKLLTQKDCIVLSVGCCLLIEFRVVCCL